VQSVRLGSLTPVTHGIFSAGLLWGCRRSVENLLTVREELSISLVLMCCILFVVAISGVTVVTGFLSPSCNRSLQQVFHLSTC
jgi:hypothetical protein